MTYSCVFQGVFRITTNENVEFLVQAANDEEREEWTTAIANAIRRLDIKYKVVIKKEILESDGWGGGGGCISLPVPIYFFRQVNGNLTVWVS